MVPPANPTGDEYPETRTESIANNWAPAQRPLQDAFEAALTTHVFDEETVKSNNPPPALSVSKSKKYTFCIHLIIIYCCALLTLYPTPLFSAWYPQIIIIPFFIFFVTPCFSC